MTVWIESPFDNLPSEGFRKQRYWMMAEAFVAAGHAVVYFTSDFNHGTKARRVLHSEASDVRTDARPRLILVPTPPYRANVSLARVRSHAAYARGLRRAAEAQLAVGRPDLVVAAMPTPSSACALQRVARAAGAKFVLDVQDAWPETFARLLPGPLKAFAPLLFAPWRARVRRLYRTADFVSGVSERYRALTGRDDYLCAYHGVCGETPRAEAKAVRTPGVPPRRLVYVGNLGTGYDLMTVLEALAADATLTLDIAGGGPEERALRERVVRLGLGERVTFHGYRRAADVQALLARADVGVIPMRDDSWVGLPYKLGDYLAAGLKVVSSLHGECGDLLVRAGLGATYDFGSSESLRAALARVAALSETETVLPDCLREDRIYPAYVAAVTARA